MMEKISYNKAFTLVELIVVITILAILATIGFISLIGYQSKARESVRIWDLNTIAKGLEIFKASEWYFPAPSDPFSITFSWSLAWQQWDFWQDTQKVLKNVPELPRDPLTGNLYAYSVINTGQEYELGSLSEVSMSYSPLIIHSAYAAQNYYTRIKGNYNKQIVVVKKGTDMYFLWVPTLVTTETASLSVDDVLLHQSFAIEWSQNLPGTYSGSLGEWINHDGDTSFTPWSLIEFTAPIIYQGTNTELSGINDKEILGSNIKSYYTESNIWGSDVVYQNLEEVAVGEEVSYVNSLIKTKVAGLSTDDIKLSNESYLKTWEAAKFITVWKTDNSGDSGDNQILLPLMCPWEYDFEIDWWDGTSDTITSCNQSEKLHTFPAPGTYTITIDGLIHGFSFHPDSGTIAYNTIDTIAEKLYSYLLPQSNAVVMAEDFADSVKKLIEIVQWGNMRLDNSWSQFKWIENLTISAGDKPYLWNITNASKMFYYSQDFNADLRNWSTSSFEDISNIFAFSTNTSPNISTWNVARVVDMSNAFYISDFNGNISAWNTGSAENMSNMFAESNFTGDISNWNTSNVTNMFRMFYISSFNGDISDWDTGNVENMSKMFACYEFVSTNCSSFNGDISNWDTSKVTNMSAMFQWSPSFFWPPTYNPFDQNIASWDVSSVTDCTDFDLHTLSTWYGTEKPNFTCAL